MVEKEVLVKNPTGLHARPAAALTAKAKNFQSKVEIINGTITANAKSIFSVLAAEMSCGTTVTIRTTGEDEQEACDEIYQYISNLEE